MKKILSFMVLFTTMICTAFAQKLTDEDIEALKPYHYQTKLLLNFVPVYIGMGGNNFTAGYGVNADGFIGKYASFSAGIATAGYMDNNANKGNDNAFAGASDSYQGVKKAGETFVNVNLHLLDKIGIGKVKFEKYKGSSTDMSGTTYQHYDMYSKKGPVRKIIAVRGGVYLWQNCVVPETSDQWLMLKTGTTTPTVAATDRTFTTLYTTNFTVGLGSEKFVANSDMGKGGIVSYFRNFYVDALINSSTTMDNHVDKLNNSYAYQIGQGNLTKVSMGWRVGWKLVGLGRKYWTAGYLLEAGVRPGIEGRGAYFQLGLLFGTKYPFVPMK